MSNYQAIKNDPARYAAYLASRRAYYARTQDARRAARLKYYYAHRDKARAYYQQRKVQA